MKNYSQIIAKIILFYCFWQNISYAQNFQSADSAKILPAIIVKDKSNIFFSPQVSNAFIINNQSPQHKQTFQDALNFVPGVIAQDKAGQEARLSIRGSGLSRNFHLRGINLYQDGIPINLADGSADFQDIDLSAFSSIEVYKGSTAMRLGSSTLGGAINFVSPTGYTADKLTLTAQTGSFSSRKAHISSGAVIGNNDYYISASTSNSNGFRQQNKQENQMIFANVGHKISQNIQNRSYFSFVNSHLELPGALTEAQINSDSTVANTSNFSNKQERNVEQFRFANKTTWFNDNITINSGFYLTAKNLDHPIHQVVSDKSINYGFFVDSVYNNNIFAKQNQLFTGINIGKTSNQSKRFVNNVGGKGNLLEDGEQNAENIIFFAENNTKINEKLNFLAGSQLLYSGRTYQDDFLTNGNQSGTRRYYGISPKLGLVYWQSPKWQLYSNISSAYEPPTFTELRQGNVAGLANIDAQKSYTIEFGTKKQSTDSHIDIAFYHSQLRDELVLYRVGSTTQAINAKKTMHQGLELFSENKIAKNIGYGGDILIKLAYSFNDFRFVDDLTYGNNTIPGAPRHYIKSELKYRNKQFSLAPNIEILPDGIVVDSVNKNKSNAYWLLGLTSAIDIDAGTAIFVEAKNLLNKKYVASIDSASIATINSASYHPGSPRAIYVGIKYKL